MSVVQVHAKKNEKKRTKDVDDSADLGYLLCMVTTTIYNGRLVRLGCKRWIVRDIAGVQVEIGVDTRKKSRKKKKNFCKKA